MTTASALPRFTTGRSMLVTGAVRFMHCLPAFHDTDTAVGQAENRLHMIKAVMVTTIGD